MTESQIQKQIVAYLRASGITPGVQRFGRRTSIAPGWPDIVFCMKNTRGQSVPVGLEIKTEKGKLSVAQANMRVALLKDGWSILVVRSLEEAVDWINRLKR